MALGFEEAVLLETAAICALRRNLSLAILPNGSIRTAGSDNYRLPKQRRAEWANAFLLAEMLGWPCFTQVERFTLTRCLPPSNSVLNMGCVVAGSLACGDCRASVR